MRYSRLAIVLLIMLAGMPASLAAQSDLVNHDPDAARLVTSDIPHFWEVFDRASLVTAGELFQKDYIDAGSPGLQDFARKRIQSGSYLAAIVASRPRYYAAIRGNTLALDTARSIKDSIRAAFRRLKNLYRDAVFPDVYFVIGALGSAGTTSSNGLLIGVEMNARDEQTPLGELSDWERAVVQPISRLRYVVAHELIHRQQPADTVARTLLTESLREGIADFLGEMISGGNINPRQHEYGDLHEGALWEEFRHEMSGTDVSHWLYQGDKATDRPADLGYYVGYKICEAFYRRVPDKNEALRRIILMNDAPEFLRESGYQPAQR